ncbi:ComF family protein [Enterobacter sp. Bisph1]|uniref:ComF family protein n=1 Tax=Enterobacter sp. Bisph1 TaxID=1274399 RepID=UPI00057BF768|nr:ComF family protein [Enterobacter sp. Bisph1]
MQVNIKEISGNWDFGVVMDKHSKRSIFTGNNQWGYNSFDTARTEVGEALYQLKYQSDWNKVGPLAECLYIEAYPLFERVGFIVPMPASTIRPRQPVTDIAKALAQRANRPCFDKLLINTSLGAADASSKNLHTKQQKVAALANRFYVNPVISKQGCWNVLLIDDIYHTGASMEAACATLRDYNRVNKIFVAALTWR